LSAPVLTVPQGGPIASRPRRENLFDTERFFRAAIGGVARRLSFFANTQTNSDIDAAGAFAKPPGSTNMVGPGGSLPRGHYLRVFGVNAYITRRQVGGTGTITMSSFPDVQRLWDMGYISIMLGATSYLDTQFVRLCSGTGIQGPVSVGQVATSFFNQQMGSGNCASYFDLSIPTKVRQQVKVTKVCIGAVGGKPVIVPVSGGAPTQEGMAKAIAAFAKGGGDKAKVSVEVAARVAQAIRAASFRDVSVPRMPIEFSETENFSVDLTYPTRPVINNDSYDIIMNLVSIYLKPLSA